MEEKKNAYIRNIVKEIMRECHSIKISVNKNFLTYLTKLLLIDPNWGIDENFFTQRDQVQEFVKYVIKELLTTQNKPILITIKIQFYFFCNLEHLDLFIKMERKTLENKVVSLKDDIFKTTDTDDENKLDLLLKKIVYYITIITGLGNPINSKVYEEACVALKSIMDEEELKEFVMASKDIKEDRLEYVSRVVAGIRLFNRDCEKGGEGIENLPELLQKATETIKSSIEATLILIMEKVNALTTVLDKCFIIKSTYAGYQLKLIIPDVVWTLLSTFDINYIKDLLIFFRQYELLIRKIEEGLENVSNKNQLISRSMEKLLKKIHDTVYMKLAIPADKIFPLFEELYDIWFQLQDQGLLLSRYSKVLINLDNYANQTDYNQCIINQCFLHEVPWAPERSHSRIHLNTVRHNPEVDVLTIDSSTSINSAEFEYLGFCCWKLIQTGGCLIPGNPSIGIVKYQEKKYVLSCVEAFNAFVRDPKLYINHVLDLARKKPQLIIFFGLRERLEEVFKITQLVQSKEDMRLCDNKSVQVPCHIDTEYSSKKEPWNIWQLKAEALTLAHVSSAKTVSVQTTKSGSSSHVRTQTVIYKDVAVQTPTVNYPNTPKPSRFIYGLRSRKDDNQFVIDLTRPVDE